MTDHELQVLLAYEKGRAYERQQIILALQYQAGVDECDVKSPANCNLYAAALRWVADWLRRGHDEDARMDEPAQEGE